MIYLEEYHMESLSERIEKLSNLIETSDHIIIGAGAGLSTSAGIEYGGERFKKHFAEFIKKYDFTDKIGRAHV